jgi:hypothetical protein
LKHWYSITTLHCFTTQKISTWSVPSSSFYMVTLLSLSTLIEVRSWFSVVK